MTISIYVSRFKLPMFKSTARWHQSFAASLRHSRSLLHRSIEDAASLRACRPYSRGQPPMPGDGVRRGWTSCESKSLWQVSESDPGGRSQQTLSCLRATQTGRKVPGMFYSEVPTCTVDAGHPTPAPDWIRLSREQTADSYRVHQKCTLFP
jgi:hypothetical protein